MFLTIRVPVRISALLVIPNKLAAESARSCGRSNHGSKRGINIGLQAITLGSARPRTQDRATVGMPAKYILALGRST